MAKENKDAKQPELNKKDLDYILASYDKRNQSQNRLNKQSDEYNSKLNESKTLSNDINKLTDDLDKKYAELNKNKDETLKIDKELADLKKDEIANADIIKKKNEDRNKLLQEQKKIEEEFKKLDEEHSNALKEREKKHREIIEVRKKENKLRTEDTYKKIDDSMGSIADQTKNLFDINTQNNASKTTAVALDEIHNKLLVEGVNENSKLVGITNLLQEATSKNAIAYSNMVADVDLAGVSNAKLLDIEEQKQEAKKIENMLNDESLLIEISRMSNGDEVLQQLRDQHSVLKQQITVHEAANATIERGKVTSAVVIDTIEDGFDIVDRGISMLPGGDKIAKILGLPALKKQIITDVGGSMNDAFVKAGGGIKGAFAAAKEGAGGMLSILSGPGGLLLGAGLLAGAVGMIGKAFGEADRAVSEMQKTMEVSKSEAVKMQGAATDLAGEIGMVGINSKEVMKTMGGLREAFGGMRIDPSTNGEMKMLVEQGTILGEKFGISAQETKDLYSQSKIMGVSMEEMTATATKFGDKTIGAKETLKIMASLPKKITVGFKGTVQQITAAAIKAKMMGTSLEEMSEIGDKMLDIEGSLNAEMEARILTGKNINLDRARELALSGDVAGLQDEVLSQMGSLSEFKEMDIMAQKSMADAMGMSVEQMTTMLSKAEENAALGVSSKQMQEDMAKSAEEMNELAEKAAKSGKGAYAEELKKAAAVKESADIQEKIANIMTKIQEKITKMVLPLVNMAHAFFDSAAGGQLIDDVLSGVGDLLSGIGSGISYVVDKFSFLGGIFKSLQENLGILKIIGYALLVPLGLMAIALAADFALKAKTFAIEKAKLVQDKLVQGFTLVKTAATWAYNLAMSGGLVPTIAMTAASWGLNASFLANPVVLIVVGIMALIAAIYLAYKNFDSFRAIVDNVWEVITGLFDSFMDGIVYIWDMIKPFMEVKKVIGIVMDALSYLWDLFITVASFSPLGLLIQGLMTVWENIDTIKNSIMDVFGSISSFIEGILSKITGGIDALADGVKSLTSWIPGMGGDDKEEPSGDSGGSGGSVVTPKASGGRVTSPTGYTLVGEGGPELVQLPQASNVVNAGATSGMMSGAGTSPVSAPGGSGGTDMTKVVDLLQQILNVASQPAVLQLGDKFVQEVDSKIQLRAGMRVNTDNTWGKTV